MRPLLWPEMWPASFPDLVHQANKCRACGLWLEAGVLYLKAASVAPVAALETEMLHAAWVCSERAGGRISELMGLDD